MKYEDSWLADPAREGRETGMPGAAASADFLTSYFKTIGLQPLGDDFREPFEFNSGTRVDAAKTTLTVSGEKDPVKFDLDQDFRPLAFSESGSVEGDVVFAGYGLSAPDDAKNPRYNSFDGLDVKDKIVLLFRYVPENVDAPRRAHLNRYAGLRYKAMMARERGARAVLVVTGPNSPGAGELLELTNDGSHSGSGIIAASINSAVADALLAPSGKNLKDLQTGLDTENPHAEGGFLLPKVHVKLDVGIERLKKTDHNVVGCIPPNGDDGEYIMRRAPTTIIWATVSSAVPWPMRTKRARFIPARMTTLPAPRWSWNSRLPSPRSAPTIRTSPAAESSSRSGRARRLGSSARPRFAKSRPCR